MVRPPSFTTQQAAEDIGRQLTAWRKLRGLTAQQAADRVGVTRQTIGRIERGDPAVGLGVFLGTCRALGVLQQVVEATDPYETPFGRARADQSLPKRVRHGRGSGVGLMSSPVLDVNPGPGAPRTGD